MPKKKLLTGQAPVPPTAGDVSRDISVAGTSVQLVSVQGGRDYQEDRYLVDAIDITAKEAKSFLAGIFSDAAKKTDSYEAGSTGTALVITPDLQLKTAYLGDSPVVVFVHDPATGDVTATKLTKDHHAALPAEKARIERAGGYVASNGRVDGSLMLSRAFGDGGYLGVSRDPEFGAADLRKEIEAGREVYVCISSDGLFERLEPEDYATTLKAALRQKKENNLAAIFAATAHGSGSSDNITALVVKVPKALKEGLFLAVADGHGGSATSPAVIESFEQSLAKRRAAPKP